MLVLAPGLAWAWMPLLPVPEGVEADPFEVDDWDTLLQMQGDIATGTAIEEGDVLAMQDRATLTDEWSEDSRKIFVPSTPSPSSSTLLLATQCQHGCRRSNRPLRTASEHTMTYR